MRVTPFGGAPSIESDLDRSWGQINGHAGIFCLHAHFTLGKNPCSAEGSSRVKRRVQVSIREPAELF